jgi:hypothetical protein
LAQFYSESARLVLREKLWERCRGVLGEYSLMAASKAALLIVIEAEAAITQRMWSV